MRIADIPQEVLQAFRDGVVVPAVPLALHDDRTLDERRQRALLRYYIDAGVGGVAVGVHTTQFAIRDPEHGLFETVLELASRAVDDWCGKRQRRILKIAGVCGQTGQACQEAETAVALGYSAGLLSLSALPDEGVDALAAHCRAVAEILPVIGFYLQPAAGGRLLSYAFWRRFVELDNILAIKIAAFNRYQTLDVVRAIADADAADRITLYTGNDDNIVMDLLTPFRFQAEQDVQPVTFSGGLLGHWAVWTTAAVDLLERIKTIRTSGGPLPQEMLTLAAQVTDMNAALFDAANGYRGCIPGVQEVLRRQGLFEGTWCLDPDEVLSPGQSEELDRVTRAYRRLTDDAFVAENLSTWLEP
ncbi:dihydrodipicolinate synthase family protein [bacterium]|nr:dihydrodipicolinate synthase family protein [bacterium]